MPDHNYLNGLGQLAESPQVGYLCFFKLFEIDEDLGGKPIVGRHIFPFITRQPAKRF